MTDQTPEELDALVAELIFLSSPVAEHMSDGRRITAFCKYVGSAISAITALRAREALIEAAAIERAAATVDDFRRDPCSAGLGCDPMLDAILALVKPGARTLLDQRIAEAEQAGYERGLREAADVCRKIRNDPEINDDEATGAMCCASDILELLQGNVG